MKIVDFDKIKVGTKFMRRHHISQIMATCGNENVTALYEKKADTVVCLICGSPLPHSFVMGNPGMECVVEEVKG